MRVLLILPDYPMVDRASGYLRLSKIIAQLARVAKVDACILYGDIQAAKIGAAAMAGYKAQLSDFGISDVGPNFLRALDANDYDFVFIEFYYLASPKLLREIRLRQRRARIVIDSVDLHFQRLRSKADLSGVPADFETARQVELDELSAYASVDVVIAVSQDEEELLRERVAEAKFCTVPNFYTLHPRPDGPGVVDDSLVFVGGFGHAPNVDAVEFFLRDVFPHVLRSRPKATFTIVGSDPPPEVTALISDRVRVTGYVPSTTPLLHASAASIAPLRFGGGMKGKVGEAMAHGLPVVTTTCGAEGYGFEHERHVLIADSPTDFADATVRLLADAALRERVAVAGFDFIRERLSDSAIPGYVDKLMHLVEATTPKSVPGADRVVHAVNQIYERHLKWRFARRAVS